MGRITMRSNIPRGGAAALLTIGIAFPLSAQTAGSLPARVPDSGFVQLRINPAKLDSVLVLMRSLDGAQPGSPVWGELQRKIAGLLPQPTRFEFRPSNGSGRPRGWIGFTVDAAPQMREVNREGEFVTYYTYPKIITIDGESPAQRAGIQPGDTLVAYNGLDLIGRAFNMTQLLVPEKKLEVTVRRDGEKKDYAVTVARAPERVSVRRIGFDDELEIARRRAMAEVVASRSRMPSGTATALIPGGSGVNAGPRGGGGGLPMAGRLFAINPNGMFGASVSPVGPELAKKFSLERGVLVNEVPEGSPAFESGLRVGDVIVSVAGQPVVSLGELRELVGMHASRGSVPLQFVRDRKRHNITVTW